MWILSVRPVERPWGAELLTLEPPENLKHRNPWGLMMAPEVCNPSDTQGQLGEGQAENHQDSDGFTKEAKHIEWWNPRG